MEPTIRIGGRTFRVSRSPGADSVSWNRIEPALRDETNVALRRELRMVVHDLGGQPALLDDLALLEELRALVELGRLHLRGDDADLRREDARDEDARDEEAPEEDARRDDVVRVKREAVELEAAPPAEVVEETNVVTPKIEMEYKVVLLDSGLSAHQPAAETKLVAPPTYIRLSLSQQKASPSFPKGAMLEISGGKVDAFTDEKCENALDLSKPLPRASVLGTGMNVWLKAKSKGKFKVKLTAEDPSDGRFTREGPAEEEMAVVELKMKVFEHDTGAIAGLSVDPDTDPATKYHDDLVALALPDPKEITGASKVTAGRLLHVQRATHHGRVKVVLPKLDGGDWPAGCEAYKVVLADQGKRSGSLRFFDAEVGGAAQAWPLEVSVAALTAGEKVFWAEGASATNAWRDLVLEVGLDRDVGGLPKGAKHHGDWCRLTVVQISSVAIHVVVPAGDPNPWNAGQRRYYVNLASDPDGRKIKLRAKLAAKLAGVRVHFMLAPDANNTKAANWGQDLPAAWKWKDMHAGFKHVDRADRKKLLSVSADTDAEGMAEVEVTLSRWGGDVFWPGAYIDQDPHLAKYVRGHATLGAREPVLSERIEVWRRLWYDMIKAQGYNPPDPAAAAGSYTAVRAELDKSGDRIIQKAAAPAGTYYPEFQFNVGSASTTDVIVVGGHNKAGFFTAATVEKDKPLKASIVVCQYQFDPDGNTAVVTRNITQSPSPAISMGGNIVKPALPGGALVVRGEWESVNDPTKKGALADADISIPKPRTSREHVVVTLPAAAPAPTVADPIKITLQLQQASGPWLGESDGVKLLVVYDPTDVPDYNDTVVHEIGHSLNQTPRPGNQPTGTPNHPNQYLKNGSHCNKGNKKCVMYDSGPQATAIHAYCEVCHPYVLVEDMSRFV